MVLGVVSDTHLTKWSQSLPTPLLEGLRGVDAILHAGDLMTVEVLEMLKEIAPVEAVAGNNDPWPLFQLLGRKKLLSYENVTVGLVHGDCDRGTATICAARSFEANTVQCIVFGHSHNPYCEFHDGVLLFNPGSPTQKRTNKRYSYGILRINGRTIDPELCYFDAK